MPRSNGGEGMCWCSSQGGSLCSGDLHRVPVQDAGSPSPAQPRSPPQLVTAGAVTRAQPGTEQKVRGRKHLASREQQQGFDLGQRGFSPTLPADAGNITSSQLPGRRSENNCTHGACVILSPVHGLGCFAGRSAYEQRSASYLQSSAGCRAVPQKPA